MAPYLTKIHALTKVRAGMRFTRLTVLGAVRRDRDISGHSILVWHCRCECGNEIETRSPNLLSGDTNSCGCYVRDKLIERATHGHTKSGKHSTEYVCWKNIIARCSDQNADAYPWYGGRGIKVCERWQKFENFIADMGFKPSPKHSIERDDVDRDYEPGNCRWATAAEQGANKRNTRLLTAFGKTMHMNEWCRHLGILQGTLWDRLDRGWSVERALTEPVKRRT
jgi:hypothetical protein